MRDWNNLPAIALCVHNEININNDDVTVVPSSVADNHSPRDILSGGIGWKPDPDSPDTVHNISVKINADENDAEIRTVKLNVEGVTAVELLVYKDGALVGSSGLLPVSGPFGTIEQPLNLVGDELIVRVTEDNDDSTDTEVGGLEADACYHPLAISTTAPLTTVVSTTAFTGSVTTVTSVTGLSTTPSGWTSWSPWTCSVTCGEGVRQRFRECPATTVGYIGSNPCEGASSQSEPCFEPDCPTTPNWSEWTPWSACDVLCGEGIKTRYRECNSPAPLPGQVGCFGPKEENITCTESPCECVFDTTAFRDMFGYEPNDIVGYMEKDGIEGASSDEELVRLGDHVGGDATIYVDCNECICETGSFNCSLKSCENCTYSHWGPWTPCSKTCDVGQRSRSRSLLSGPQLQTCTEPREEREDCNTDSCPGVSEWTTWTPWTECTNVSDCTVGTRTRSRDCTSPTGCGEGDPIEIEPCGQSCEEPVANCTDNRVWADCAFTCPHSCIDLRLDAYCTEPEACEPGCKCPDGQVTGVDGSCVAVDKCPCYTDEGVSVWPNIWYTPPDEPCKKCMCATNHSLVCTVDPDCCDWDEWTSWGECSVECGEGTRNRYRAQISGINCGSNTESDDCNPGVCPPGCVVNGTDYEYGDKITEDLCQACYCTEDNPYYCTNKTLSDIDGGWSEWGEWTQCSSSCTGGMKTRTRLCNTPLPQCNGDPCPGDNIEETPCNFMTPCCDTTPYGPWSDCSQTCGNGTQSRDRTFVESTSQFLCSDDLTETRACNYGDCNMTCVVSDWQDWSGCSVTCGQGVQTRTRSIQVLAADCPEDLLDENICNRGDCECEENLIWSNYSSCQRTCDERTGYFNMTGCSEVNQGCVCPDGLYLDDNGTCVNTSECDKCVDKNGIERQPGEIFNEGCYTCECVMGEVQCNPVCETPTCGPNEQLNYNVPNSCCPVCEPIQATCQKYTRTEILSDPVSRCVSEEPVTIDYCSGSCGNSTSQSILMLSADDATTADDCRCCTGGYTEWTLP